VTLTNIRSLFSRRRAFALLALAVALMVLGACTPDQKDAWTTLHSDREANGVAPAGWRADLQVKAQAWAEHLAEPGVPFAHSSLADGVTQCWRSLGENIASNASIGGAEESFMASPGHRANILNGSYNSYAVGVAWTPDGRVFVVQEFAQSC
jgi:uncharacterized protein YkwD